MRRIGLLLAVWLLVTLVVAQEPLKVTIIDVGQGDATLIEAPGGQVVLVDGGEDDNQVLNYLRSHDIGQVDLVTATHPHADHVGGLAAVIRHYRPRFYMDNGMPYTTQTYYALLEAVQAAGSQLLEPSTRRITLGEVTLQILPPPQDESLDPNNNSIGIIVDYGEFEMSIAGDAEEAEWTYWATQHPDLLQDVEVHKSSHHGSRNGDSPLTMQRLHPEVVVISVGAGNDYGHPHPEALRLYAAIGAEIYRTDQQGSLTITATPDGQYDIHGEDARAGTPIPAPTPPPSTGAGGVAITCVLYNPAGQDAGNETVTLRALDPVRVDGWTLKDEVGHTFALRGSLQAGRSYSIINDGDAVWNNSGDTAMLYDAGGRLVDQFAYGGGGSQACRGP